MQPSRHRWCLCGDWAAEFRCNTMRAKWVPPLVCPRSCLLPSLNPLSHVTATSVAHNMWVDQPEPSAQAFSCVLIWGMHALAKCCTCHVCCIYTGYGSVSPSGTDGADAGSESRGKPLSCCPVRQAQQGMVACTAQHTGAAHAPLLGCIIFCHVQPLRSPGLCSTCVSTFAFYCAPCPQAVHDGESWRRGCEEARALADSLSSQVQSLTEEKAVSVCALVPFLLCNWVWCIHFVLVMLAETWLATCCIFEEMHAV